MPNNCLLPEWCYSKIQNAICEFAAMGDLYLVDHDLYERSISHRFASCLHTEFYPDWHVDSEYSKVSDEPKLYRVVESVSKKVIKKKTLEIASRLANNEIRTDSPLYEIAFRSALPDVIVHRRGEITPEHNLLIIEVKVNRKADQGDRIKLIEFTRGLKFNGKVALKYQFGLAVSFYADTEDQPNVVANLYKDGKLQQDGVRSASCNSPKFSGFFAL